MNTHHLRAACALGFALVATPAIAAPCDVSGAEPMPAFMPDAPITLNEVIGAVRAVAPEVRMASLEARALDAEALQARRPLNPTLSLERENFSGQGAFAGLDQAETTFTLAQTFQLGGKRGLSYRAGRARAQFGAADCAAVLREMELEASLSFYELAAAVEVAELAENAAALADEVAAAVAARVQAGGAAPPELARARADVAAAQAGALSAEASVVERRYALAALWGVSEPDFGVPTPKMPADALTSEGDVAAIDHPALARAEAAADARRAEERLARAQAYPDVTVAAGLRRFEATGEDAYVASVSVPFPLFNRNRDAARAAGLRGDASVANSAAVSARLLSQQRAAVAARNAAQGGLAALEDDGLPQAESAYAAAVRGYEVGRFDLTTTLDARRALIESRLAVIDARLALHAADMRLRSLIGAAPFDGDAFND